MNRGISVKRCLGPPGIAPANHSMQASTAAFDFVPPLQSPHIFLEFLSTVRTIGSAKGKNRLVPDAHLACNALEIEKCDYRVKFLWCMGYGTHLSVRCEKHLRMLVCAFLLFVSSS